MACGGLKFLEVGLHPKYKKNYTQRVVELAIEMVEFVQSSTFIFGTKLNLKIGVHHGSCIYGVIGYHKPQFSLIGDTVNTTSRHCTTGESGSVVLSLAAKAKIDVSNFPNGVTRNVPMKGKGNVDVFMIIIKKSAPSIVDLKFPERVSVGSIAGSPSPHQLSRGAPVGNHFGRRRATILHRDSITSPVTNLPHSILSKYYNGTGTPQKTESKVLARIDEAELFDRDKIMAPHDEGPAFNYVNDINDQTILGDQSMRALVQPERESTITDGDSSEEESYEDVMKSNPAETNIASTMIRKILGFSIGFKSGKENVEAFFAKQMHIKYRHKMVESLLYVLGLVLLQEILILATFDPAIEIGYIRFLLFIWLLFSAIYVFIDNKVKGWVTILLLIFKTLIYFGDYIHLCISISCKAERTSLAYYLFAFHCMIDSVMCISMGIFTVGQLLGINCIEYFLLLAATVSLQFKNSSMPSFIMLFTFFFIFNLVDLMNHFETELTLFFNYVKIEQKGYYLNTFVDRLLPKHIKGVATCGTEKYSNVTLLFADIVGFTEYSSGKNPRQVVEMLSQLFTAFDKECNKLNLYKLFTIGDCYVVMSFLDKNNRKKPKEEANDVVQLAIFMIKTIIEVRKKINFEKLNMRIGIHTVAVLANPLGHSIRRSHRHRHREVRSLRT